MHHPGKKERVLKFLKKKNEKVILFLEAFFIAARNLFTSDVVSSSEPRFYLYLFLYFMWPPHLFSYSA